MNDVTTEPASLKSTTASPPPSPGPSEVITWTLSASPQVDLKVAKVLAVVEATTKVPPAGMLTFASTTPSANEAESSSHFQPCSDTAASP